MDATAQRDSRDDGMPPDCARIEAQVGDIKQLLDSMDPSRFRLSAMYVQVVDE